MEIKFPVLVRQTFTSLLTSPLRKQDIIHQIYAVANNSALTIIICVAFAAMVTILEASFHMKLIIQNDAMVPGFAALLILRELGSVTAALLLTSRVGAGITAEISIMKITEQIEALIMLGIDPIRFLVVPRFIACTLGGFVISIIANLVCVYCAMLVSEFKLGYTFGSFLAAMNVFVHFHDLVFAAIKGACFGAVIPLISCYHGFHCKNGAEGVGLATTNSVVSSSVAIILMDFILGWIFSSFY